MSNFKIRSAGPKSADLYIYDDIGTGFFGGIGAKQVIDEVGKLKNIDLLNVRINSPGGDVFEGLAIYNFLKRYNAKVVVDIDGLAASIASVIAMAGAEVNIAKNAMFMIHSPFTGMVGTADDFRKQADLLDQVTDGLISTYVGRTKQDHAKVADWMTAETWFTAAEAVEFGFADAVTEDLQIAARFDPTRFRNAPKNFGSVAPERVPNVYRAKIADMQRRAKQFGTSP